MINKKTIGDRLRKERSERGMSMSVAAAAIGITKPALSNYENGWRVPRDEEKIKIARYYEKSVEDLFFST